MVVDCRCTKAATHWSWVAGVADPSNPMGAWALHAPEILSVDGRMLRSGSANLSASGLKQQDNDIVILREPSAARAFEALFEQIS